LLFQLLFPHLVFALTMCQKINKQVSYDNQWFPSCELYIIAYSKFEYLAIAATISDRHIGYKSGSQNDTFEVGLGNLKLIYSGKEGKLTQYINRKRKVCDLDGTLLYIMYTISFILSDMSSKFRFITKGQRISRADIQVLCLIWKWLYSKCSGDNVSSILIILIEFSFSNTSFY
jgi:hypothetical protein